MTHRGNVVDRAHYCIRFSAVGSLRNRTVCEDMVLCDFTVAQEVFGGLNKQFCSEPTVYEIVCNQPKRKVEESEEVQSTTKGPVIHQVPIHHPCSFATDTIHAR
jgi:hypothetical protein